VIIKYTRLLPGLSWIHPFFGAFFILITSTSKKISLADQIFAILLLGCTVAVVAVTKNVIVIIPSVFMLLYIFLKPTMGGEVLLIKILLAYCFFGVAYGATLAFHDGYRVGMWGEEPNFSGISLTMLYILALSRKYCVKISVLLLIALIYISLSRTLLIATFLITFMFVFKERKFLIYSIIFIMCITLVYKPYLVSEYLYLFSNSGYIESSDRLINLNDSSTNLRIKLELLWVDVWMSDIKNIVFGVSMDEYAYLTQVDPGKVVHNSIIQKAVRDGILLTSLLIVFMFRFLPIWVVPIFLFYGVFLHSTLSVFWIISMSFLMLPKIGSEYIFQTPKQYAIKVKNGI
jgi:hypothetical protein